MNTDTDSILKREIDAAEGSFIASVRFDLIWDGNKFAQMCKAMHAATKSAAGKSELPRNISQLFWYCGQFLPSWLDQRDFSVGQPDVDYDKVKKILKALGDAWFGDDCLIDDDRFADEIQSI